MRGMVLDTVVALAVLSAACSGEAEDEARGLLDVSTATTTAEATRTATPAPTLAVTPTGTREPTPAPTPAPTKEPTAVPTVAPTTAPASLPTVAATPKVTTTPAVYYANCAAVRAAGAAPIRRGDPGYGSHLDRDGDGVGCE